MKKVLFVGLLIGLTGCSDGIGKAVNGTNGTNGQDGSSCTIQKVSGGAIISCGDGTSVTVNDGQNGVDGKDGVDGQNGINGTNGIDGKDGVDGINGKDGQNGADGKDGASIITPGNNFVGPGTLKYTSSTCTLINGTNKYTKVSNTGAGTAIYTTSTCTSASKVIDFSAVSSYWVGSTSLATYSNGVLQVITF